MQDDKDHQQTKGEWLMVLGTAFGDNPETLPAIRLLHDRGCLIPIPRPIVVVSNRDDHARINQTLRRLGISDQEAGWITGLHDVPADIPDGDMRDWMKDITERLQCIQEIVTPPLAIEAE